MSVLFEEINSSKGLTRFVCESREKVNWKSIKNGLFVPHWYSLSQAFKEVFLPRGYPNSVCPDYLAYQIWDSLQAFGSSITGTLATHNVLKGIGVGDQSASVMSATFTWLLKDGTGMLGRIVFTYFKGSNLDVECKKWRLFADIINDFATGLDMICPLFPSSLLALQCSSGLIKSLVGTIGGATRAALTQHQARDNNLADVSAKDASQETLVNLAALVTSLLIVPLITESDHVVWLMFVFLTAMHIYCNYRAVKAVNMEVFNPARWSSFIEEYIFNQNTGSIEEINQHENVWFLSTHQLHEQIKSGVPLSEHKLTDKQLTDLANCFADIDYILSFSNQQKDVQNVLISFIEGKDSARNKLKAHFHANLIILTTKTHKSRSSNIKLPNITDDQSPKNAYTNCCDNYADTLNVINKLFDEISINAISKGWNMDKFIFLENGWRIKKPPSNKKLN